MGFETNVEIRISILEIPCVPMFRQNRQLWLFGLNLPKYTFWGRNFNNLSLDSESKPPIYHVCQFSVKMDNFWFPGINLGKLPNYVQYFGLNVVEDFAEDWVEAEMSWMEVDGAGRKWVHGLEIPESNVKNKKEQKLLGIMFGWSLSFEDQVISLCKKDSQKLHARIVSYMDLPKRKVLMKAFFTFQFNYCSLIWMLESRILNNPSNNIQERTLTLTY